MKTSCITPPPKDRFIQLHKWHVDFCQDNHAAALLLSFFIAWHDWKLDHDRYYRRANDIAEMHGDGRPHNEHAYLYFSNDELIDGCMGVYGKKAILAGLEWLAQAGVITICKNPNPRYHFDKTKYFQLHPEVCTRWLAAKQKPSSSQEQPNSNDHNDQDDCDYDRNDADEQVTTTTQLVDSKDRAFLPDREGENALPPRQNARPSCQNTRYINNTTINTTNNLQSINAREGALDLASALQDQTLSPLLTTLLTMGMDPKKFYPDTLLAISHLQQQGATKELLESAYALAAHSTQGKGFGLNYLCKVLDGLLRKQSSQHDTFRPRKHSSPTHDFSNVHYETEIPKGITWLDGIVEQGASS